MQMPRKLPVQKLIEMNEDLIRRNREYLASWEAATRGVALVSVQLQEMKDNFRPSTHKEERP